MRRAGSRCGRGRHGGSGRTISSLPDGLDTIAGDRGYRFSGGEKQRLALARLLLKAPSVVVLDEATAHLDSESEAAIQRALTTALAGRTSLVIAHRLSTVRAADQILVIDGGQVTERGAHDELLAAGGVYAGLYRTQFASQAALLLAGPIAHSTRSSRDRHTSHRRHVMRLPADSVPWQGATSHTARPFPRPVCPDRLVIGCAKPELPECEGETFRVNRRQHPDNSKFHCPGTLGSGR